MQITNEVVIIKSMFQLGIFKINFAVIKEK
jgi:hypothetical protein